MDDSSREESIAHCVEKIRTLAALEAPDRRDVLQLGYNLGRLGELTGAGRGPFWDRWKGPVAAWDRDALAQLARDLLEFSSSPDSPTPSDPAQSSRPDRPPPTAAEAVDADTPFHV